jgi:hypothetical protein
MKHKHYDMIVAWAEGKKIEVRLNGGEWHELSTPAWKGVDTEYRIKPEPDHILVTDLWRQRDYGMLHMGEFRLTFDGESGKLKSAEVLWTRD